MVKILWHNGEVPKNLKIKQVYGILFTQDGRMLIMKNKGRYTLSGGTPEKFDASIEETLRRELYEEINVTIQKPILVGYQEIDEQNGIPTYAQVRMVAMIDKIGQKRPDLDNGEIYDRLLTHPIKAIELINWGEVGRCQIEEAMKIAKEKLGIDSFTDNDEEV